MSEIFDYPTVKEVAFQIRFPHLFSIEKKIGDFQDKIILQFPDSAEVLHRQVMFADMGLEGKIEPVPERFKPDIVRKSWVFKSKSKIEVKVQTNAVSIISQEHKTYNNPKSEEKFRDVIVFVISNFFKVINVPIIKRIGLRYIDQCPLPSKENEILKKLYNSIFPIEKFSVEDTQSFYFNIRTNRKKHKIIYQEGLGKNDKGEEVLILDFDGFETDVASRDFIKIADELYEIISEEYLSIIKEPVKKYMRTGKLEID